MSDIEQIALDVARRFTEDDDAQRRAQLQVAVVEAIRAGQAPFPVGDLLDIRNQLHVMATTVVPELPRPGRRAAGSGAGPDQRPPPRTSGATLVSLPYENSTSGNNAINDIQKMLRSFGCQRFATGEDYETGELFIGGLALHHLAAGDMDEALKVMAAARGSYPRTRKQNPNQLREAAKEIL